MRWTPPALEEMAERIVQMGLSTCSVCGTGSMSVLNRPVVAEIGGNVFIAKDRSAQEAGGQDHNILFLVAVTCDVCGHVLLFDSERLTPGDQPIIDTTYE